MSQTVSTPPGVSVRRSPIVTIVAFIALGGPPSAHAQATTAPAKPAAMSHEELMTFAKAHVAIGVAHDSTDAQLAQTRNKKPEVQEQLQAQLHSQVAAILKQNGLTEADYEHKIYLVSVDPGIRKDFDAMVAQISGVPTPGMLPPAPPHVNVIPPAELPAGAVGTHIGHVINGFSDTPNGDGLLTVAIAEAKVAIQHAGLAGRQPNNLD